MSECQTPPKFTRSCSSLATSMTSGKPAMPGDERVLDRAAHGRREGEELRRRQFLVAEEHDEMVEQRLADAVGDRTASDAARRSTPWISAPNAPATRFTVRPPIAAMVLI